MLNTVAKSRTHTVGTMDAQQLLVALFFMVVLNSVATKTSSVTVRHRAFHLYSRHVRKSRFPSCYRSIGYSSTDDIVANMGEGKRGRSFFGLHCRCDAPTRQARRAESTAG